MDVEALYPSIDIEFAAQKCTELLLETGIKFKNVNIAELGLFLIYNESVSKLEQAGLLKYCPTRTSRCGRNPLFTASGTSSSREPQYFNVQDPASTRRTDVQIWTSQHGADNVTKDKSRQARDKSSGGEWVNHRGTQCASSTTHVCVFGVGHERAGYSVLGAPEIR